VLRLFFEQLGYIARSGNSREIDLWLDLVGICRFAARFTRAAAITNILAHTLGFIRFQGTGVRFLFCDPDFWQDVENNLALYF
jgi:hypothetical protein